MTDLNNNPAVVTVRGTIEKLFHTSPRFSAGRLRVDAWTTVSFAGSLMVRVHDAVILHGRWETHAKYGQQLKVSRFEFDQKPNAEGLAQYLANHPALKGIGPVRARRIADAFGADFDRVIDEQPERVAELAKVPRSAVDLLRDEWLRTRTLNATLSWLSAFALTYHQASSLVAKLGNSVVAALTEDPYRLVREIPGFGFKRVDLVAQKMGVPKHHPGRIRAGIVHCVAERVEQGDCWVEDDVLLELANGLLVMDVADSRDQIAAALDELIQDGTLACRSIGGRFLVAQPRLLEMELGLAGVFTTQLAPNPHFAGAARAVAFRAIDARLNADQRRAVQMAIEHNLVVISGAAGAGKSFVIGAITNLYVRREKSVVLAAPTGKAAKRIEEVVRREATTIHRLLRFNGATFARGADQPIDADVVIVDELSMTDVPLAWHLFQAIDFARTCVVLVGDHAQLPPVGPGNLLRDLIERQPVPTVVLDQVVRQAGVLKENSLAILRGEVRKTASPAASGGYPWVVASKFTEAAAAQRYILELFDKVLGDQLGFDLRRDVQLLTPTKKGPLGVDELNVLLQRIVQQKLWTVDVPPPPANRRPALLRHDRVIQTKNNYDLGVMNGAVGVVTSVGDKPDELTVRFDDQQDVEYTRETARELSLAYALTVHKCVHPDTLLETPQGLLPIRSIRRDGGVIATPDGPRAYDSFVENPEGELLEIVTVDGYRLTVTPEHGIDVWTDDGFARVEARNIAPGALLRLKLGVTCDSIEAPLLGEPPAADVRARRYEYPRTVTPELAEFLGLMIAGGTLYQAGFRFSSRHEDVRDRLAQLSESVFGARPKRFRIDNSYFTEVSSTQIAAWLRQLGGLKSNAKSIPVCIFRSPIFVHIPFLRGLFEDGTVNIRDDGTLDHIEWHTLYPEIEQCVRTILLRLRIIAGSTPRRPGCIYLYSQNARRFSEKVGFIAEAKRTRTRHQEGNKPRYHRETRYYLPLTTSEINRLQCALVPSRIICDTGASGIRIRGGISRHAAESAMQRMAQGRQLWTPSFVGVANLLRERLGYHYSAVREVRRTTGPSMCIRVPDGHRFLQNGFTAWNSQGSQAPCVVAIVHKSHAYQLNRNLIYTAVTRAQRTVILVGDAWAMRTGAQKTQVERRKTFLSVLDLPRWTPGES